MTAREWNAQWRRLDHFHVSGDRDRGELEIEWFTQLKHYHVDAVEHGVTQLIGHTKDNFLPGLGLLRDFIQARLGRYDRAPGTCGTCHGSTWIEAQPWKSNGVVYEGVQRCPDCGVPAPKVERSHQQPLTSVEFHEYRAGRYGRDLMPEGLQAKHPERGGNPELRAMCKALLARLTAQEEQAS